ncbi:MAG TPA: hypothetical protein OIM48_01575 [Clostridiaceae bacterium]|jgi:hypothetical protein|nr:hypothetical protein [Clostridiaceae bacterium]
MIENIDKNGIIKIKEKNIFVKIIKVKPINFNLKTALEKEAILNSYKVFLKTCNFNLQILIHTNKEDISKIINNIKQVKNEQISIVSKNYIKFINKINSEKQTSTKNYYIIIDEQFESDNKNTENIFYMLNEKYLKIKECLTRCGNQVNECKKEEVIRILHFFLNTKNNLKRNGGD